MAMAALLTTPSIPANMTSRPLPADPPGRISGLETDELLRRLLPSQQKKIPSM